MMLALALAFSLPASDGPAPLRFPLDMVLVNRDGAAASDLDPLEAWIRERLPKAVTQVERVTFLHTTRRRFEPGDAPPSVSTAYEMEVSSSKAAIDSDAVRAFLFGLARQSARTLRVHATVVERARSREAEPLLASVAPLDEFEWRRQCTQALRLADLGPAEKTNLVGSVDVEVGSGTTALLLHGDEVAYIADFAMMQTGDTLIADPVIQTIRDGVLVEATPILHPDGENLTLAVTVTIADLVRPMKTIETTLMGNPVTRQVPEVRQVRWESGSLDLPLEKAQFVVRGLFVPSSSADLDREVEIYLRVTPMSGESPAERPAGRVCSVDEASGIVLAYCRKPKQKGDRLEVVRDGRWIGTLEVQRDDSELRLIACRVVSGAFPQLDDELR
jgi:hypothetical protein